MADSRITEPSFPLYQESEGEEYMNEPQQEHFRQILLQWKQELLEEMGRTRSQMRGEAETLADPSDRATQEEEFTIELRTRERERHLIRKIESSLRAMDSGDYGYCESCGIEIGLRRLQARPTATKCIDCKTLDEVRERQVDSGFSG
jgi:DnaK suppressor protein